LFGELRLVLGQVGLVVEDVVDVLPIGAVGASARGGIGGLGLQVEAAHAEFVFNLLGALVGRDAFELQRGIGELGGGRRGHQSQLGNGGRYHGRRLTGYCGDGVGGGGGGGVARGCAAGHQKHYGQQGQGLGLHVIDRFLLF